MSNINTKNCNVVTNQSKTKVVKELNPNKSTSVIDVKPTYVDNVIKNIDIISCFRKTITQIWDKYPGHNN